MAILVYRLPDDVAARIELDHGWRRFVPSPGRDNGTYDNEEWRTMVMNCRAPRWPPNFQEGSEKVVEGPIALMPLGERPHNIMQGETQVAIRFPDPQSERNEVTRLFDQYLFAVIAFHAAL